MEGSEKKMKKIKRWINYQRRYNPKSFQRLISGILGWSITIVLYALYFIKWYLLT